MSDVGRWVLAAVAVVTAMNGYLADWNRTHLFNPTWPPHAKFHDAWTVLLGTGLGASALYSLRKGDTQTAALLLTLFWATQAASFAVPNTGGLASEFPDLVPKVSGVRLDEATASTAMLTLTAVGYVLARRLGAGCFQQHYRRVQGLIIQAYWRIRVADSA